MIRTSLLTLLLGVAAHATPQMCDPTAAMCRGLLTIDLPGSEAPVKIPYFRNFELGEVNPGVERALVVVHGIDRNADDYFRRAFGPASEAGVARKTLILAPQFQRDRDAPKSDELAFNGRWPWGANARSHGRKLGSFEVMDVILRRIADRTRFANLKRIVLVGHSAGGQFVQRYALTSPIIEGLGVPVRFVAANPSSYAWLDATRPDLGAKDPASRWTKPTDCPTYNHWGYGFEAKYRYLRGRSTAQMRARFAQREVHYLLGAEDDKVDKHLSRTCQANLQGRNRRERGELFFAWVERNLRSHRHPFTVVPGVGHDSRRIFASPQGRRLMLE